VWRQVCRMASAVVSAIAAPQAVSRRTHAQFGEHPGPDTHRVQAMNGLTRYHAVLRVLLRRPPSDPP
jgi:hypothetical protein